MHVLVTRPEGDARRTAERVAALGHEALVAPVLRIEPTGEPPPAGAFDAVLLTSANAVPAVAALAPRFASRQVFAVGDRTAALARAAGCAARSAGGDAGALAALVRSALPPGAALLHAAGAERKAEPETSLVRAGFRITPWTVYAAVAAERLPPELAAALAHGALEAGLHSSRRRPATLLRLAAEAGAAEGLLDLVHLCLSADVAAPLLEAGPARIVVAPEPDEASLLALLAAWQRPARERSPEPARGC